MSSFEDFIDQIYYINLDHREDRRTEFLEQMRLLSFPKEKITRISAIYKPDIAILGCAQSHILAIKTFLESPYKTCLILEDDFNIRNPDEFNLFFNHMKKASNISWDLLMLSGIFTKSEATTVPFLRRVFDLQTTSSYCIKKSFAPILLKNLEEGAEGLEYVFRATGRIEHSLCLDIYWRDLQKKYNCYVSYPLLGYQRPSFSDIQRREVNYADIELKKVQS